MWSEDCAERNEMNVENEDKEEENTWKIMMMMKKIELKEWFIIFFYREFSHL